MERVATATTVQPEVGEDIRLLAGQTLDLVDVARRKAELSGVEAHEAVELEARAGGDSEDLVAR